MSADLAGALSHPGQSPLAFARSVLQYFGINPCTVVAEAQPQFVGFVVELRFDGARARMTKGVVESLPSNLVGFFVNDRARSLRITNVEDPEGREASGFGLA